MARPGHGSVSKRFETLHPLLRRLVFKSASNAEPRQHLAFRETALVGRMRRGAYQPLCGGMQLSDRFVAKTENTKDYSTCKRCWEIATRHELVRETDDQG